MADDDAVAALAARAVAIAEKAQETQAAIVKQHDAIVKQQARSKRTARWLIVSIALDVTLSVVTILLTLGQVSASHSIHRSQLSACRISNSFRAGQIALWDHIIVVSAAPPHETTAERERRLAKIAAFRAYVHSQFRPVDCKSLYGK